jgi:hypothetical protein
MATGVGKVVERIRCGNCGRAVVPVVRQLRGAAIWRYTVDVIIAHDRPDGRRCATSGVVLERTS